MSPDDQAASTAPLFFLSYARTGEGAEHVPERGAHHLVFEFFGDLSDQVAELTARRAGVEPGFLDRTIGVGASWPQEVSRVLGNCQAFVPLLNGPYMTSEWCAKEWDAVSRRKVFDAHGAVEKSPIIPVIWAPYPRNLTPSVIKVVQYFSPTNPPEHNVIAAYERYGVGGLLWTNQDDAYRFVVWQLAKHIADFCHSYRVEPETVDVDSLRFIFREDVP